MTAIRAVLWLVTAICIALGLVCLVSIDWMFALIGLEPTAVNGRSELRAIYGGLFAMLGVTSLIGLLRQTSWLAAVGLAFAGLALGRVASLALDGMAGYTLMALGFEAIAALLYWLAGRGAMRA